MAGNRSNTQHACPAMLREPEGAAANPAAGVEDEVTLANVSDVGQYTVRVLKGFGMGRRRFIVITKVKRAIVMVLPDEPVVNRRLVVVLHYPRLEVLLGACPRARIGRPLHRVMANGGSHQGLSSGSSGSYTRINSGSGACLVCVGSAVGSRPNAFLITARAAIRPERAAPSIEGMSKPFRVQSPARKRLSG